MKGTIRIVRLSMSTGSVIRETIYSPIQHVHSGFSSKMAPKGL